MRDVEGARGLRGLPSIPNLCARVRRAGAALDDDAEYAGLTATEIKFLKKKKERVRALAHTGGDLCRRNDRGDDARDSLALPCS